MVIENTSPKQQDPIERTVHRLWLRILADAGQAQGQLDMTREFLEHLRIEAGFGAVLPNIPEFKVTDTVLEYEEQIRSFLRMKAITRQREIKSLIARKHFTREELELLGLSDFPREVEAA